MLRSALYVLVVSLLFISCSSDSETEEPPVPDTIAPEVNISFAGFPDATTGTTIVVSNQLNIAIDAKDEGGIAKVEAFIDNEKVGEDVSAPYQIIIDISNYTSKIFQTSKFKDYTLKVTVTDNSGNVTSKEQNINIDNELPIITNVSLIANTVIGGDNNSIVFEVEENEELNSVEVFINNQFKEQLTINNYTFNLNTTSLLDGENVLKIVATDSASNIAIFEIPFLSDNTGPEITIENLIANQIIDEEINISPILTDEYSKIFTLSIIYEEQALLAVENPDNEVYEFNPNQFPTGNSTIYIIARDELLNSTTLEVPITILRRLLQVNVPAQYFDSDRQVVAFTSKLDGTLLDEAVITQDSQQIIFRTTMELGNEEKIMLTFAENDSNRSNGGYAYFNTVTDINIKSLPTISLAYKPRIDAPPRMTYNAANGFESDNNGNIIAQGIRYLAYLNGQNLNEFYLNKYDCVTCPSYNLDKYYFKLKETDEKPYKYSWIDAPLDPDIVLTPENFTDLGVEKRYIRTSNLPSGTYSVNLQVLGFLNQEEFNGFYYHQMDLQNYRQWEIDPTIGIGYNYNPDFQLYGTQIKLSNYELNAFGSLIEDFEPLIWSVDWLENDREISISKSSDEDILGKISLGANLIDEDYVPYQWNIIFDSRTTNSIKVPEVPNQVKSWSFYNDFINKLFYISRIDIKKYEGIDSYEDYLQKVIKINKAPHLASPKIEAVYKINPVRKASSTSSYYWLFD